MKQPKALENEEITLRHITKDDEPELLEILSNSKQAQFLPLNSISEKDTKKVLDDLITSYGSEAYEMWAAIDKKNGKIAGYIGYNPVTYEDSTYIMLFMRFSTKYWGGSFPLKTAQLACNYSLSKKIPMLILFVHPNDIAGLRVFEKLGARFQSQVDVFGATFFLLSIEKNDLQNSLES